MKRLALAILLALTTSGCAMWQKVDNSIFSRFGQERKLSSAISQMEKGNVAAAGDILSAICAEKGVEGITDEALFRLSLLQLKATGEKDFLQSQQTLERLQKEYPKSPWSVQSSLLLEMVSGSNEQRRQNRSLRTQNQSLTKENQSLTKENQSLSKENKELRQNMERLKHLDLELEQKTKP